MNGEQVIGEQVNGGQVIGEQVNGEQVIGEQVIGEQVIGESGYQVWDNSGEVIPGFKIFAKGH